MSIWPRIAMATCTFSIGARKTPRNSKRPRAVVGCFCMVSLLGMSSFPLAIALKISNVNDVDSLPVICQGCLRLVVVVKRLKPRKSAATHGVVEETQTMSRGLATSFVSEKCLLFHR